MCTPPVDDLRAPPLWSRSMVERCSATLAACCMAASVAASTRSWRTCGCWGTVDVAVVAPEELDCSPVGGTVLERSRSVVELPGLAAPAVKRITSANALTWGVLAWLELVAPKRLERLGVLVVEVCVDSTSCLVPSLVPCSSFSSFSVATTGLGLSPGRDRASCRICSWADVGEDTALAGSVAYTIAPSISAA